MPPSPTNDYAWLVGLIRSEMGLALKPLSDDIHELKEQSYSREMLDAMFELRDERIHRLGQVFTQVAAIAGTAWAILSALQILHVIP